MRVISRTAPTAVLAQVRRRLASEDGFSIFVALGVLIVSSLLVAAAYAAVQGDVQQTQRDLDAKRAYYGARAGIHKFLYELNQNPNYWQTCPQQQTKTPIAPGSGQKYTFKPVPANGNASCSTTDPTSTMIDADAGTFRMQFTGYSGNPEVSRGLVASFRKDTPLDYLWYTVYETLDPNTYNVPANYQDCAAFYRTPRPSKCVNINWISGDVIKGPTYTQDQYLINGSPVFGRAGSDDKIKSSAPGTDPEDVCTNSNCGNAQFQGERVPNAPVISPPPDNDQLRIDAQRYGMKYTGLTTIALNGNTATVTNCPASGCTAPVTLNIGRYPARVPIIYVDNGSGCTPTYSPYNVIYPTTSNCGTVYVSGNYSQSLTIAADTDIVITGDITTNLNGTSLLGLVANNFVRVMHGMTGRAGPYKDQCGNTAQNVQSQTLISPIIDAAVLALKHSFIVDNYDCGPPLGSLNFKGAIAQLFRGTVGQFNQYGVDSGYLKKYDYDDRYSVSLPPYMFDIASSSWHIARETLCVPGGSAPSTAC